jgi:Protein of unknown function (DUF2934)
MHADLTDISVHVPGPAVIEIPSHQEIAVRAFVLFELRAGAGGSDLDDWLEAERQLLLERIRAVDVYGRE